VTDDLVEATTVLDADGLDLLELALGGAIPPPAVKAELDAVVLTDAENTPLARLVTSPDGARLEALRPFTRHGGPAWDPELRLEPADARARLGGSAPALVVDDVPTRADLDRVAQDPELDAETLLLAIPVGRRPVEPGAVGGAGLTRAALAFGDGLRGRRPRARIVPVVVPWPGRTGPTGRGWQRPAIDEVMRAYGASTVTMLSARRTEPERSAIAAAAGARETAVRAIYDDASAGELLRPSGSATGNGAVVLFTGLSGSGKSTIARALAEQLADGGGRRVTLLDGDEVRQHLSSELGFDAASRERNVERIGWVAALVAGHGGIAIAAPIAPFASSRAKVRAMAEAEGGAFLMVYVSTPLGVCEARDRKGLYERARAGEIPDFTGISSPYEAPADADLVIDTTSIGVDEAVAAIGAAIRQRLGD
jgi:sulfate adenylyltransferase